MRARVAMLSQVVAALEALIRKLDTQREVAIAACALAPRAEALARQAQRLGFARGRMPSEALAALVEAVAEMAADAAEISADITAGAALGGEIATALGQPLAEFTASTRDPSRMTDPRTLQKLLTTLVDCLQRVIDRQRGQDASIDAALALGEQAASFAERARAIAAGSPGLQREMLALARDLGLYAEEATRVATALAGAAEAGERAVAIITGRVNGMATPAAPTVDQRIAAIVRAAPARRGAAMDWGPASRR